MKKLFMLWLILIGATMIVPRLTSYRIFRTACLEKPLPDG